MLSVWYSTIRATGTVYDITTSHTKQVKKWLIGQKADLGVN